MIPLYIRMLHALYGYLCSLRLENIGIRVQIQKDTNDCWLVAQSFMNVHILVHIILLKLSLLVSKASSDKLLCCMKNITLPFYLNVRDTEVFGVKVTKILNSLSSRKLFLSVYIHFMFPIMTFRCFDHEKYVRV